MGYSISSINSEIDSLNGLISRSRSQITVVNDAISKLNNCMALCTSLESEIRNNFNVNGKSLDEDNAKLIPANIDSGISCLNSVIVAINGAISNYNSRIDSLNSIKKDLIRREEEARLEQSKKSRRLKTYE